MKSYLLLAAAIFILGLSSTVLGSDLIVFLECEKDGHVRSGSGVLVSAEGMVLTARHVAPRGFACKGVIGNNTHPLVELVRTRRDNFIPPEFDVALWRFLPSLDEAFAFARYCKVDVRLEGKPITAKAFSRNTKGRPTITKGTLSSIIPSEEGLVETDILVGRKKSGGPVFLADSDSLLGIVAGGNFDPATGVPDAYSIFLADVVAEALHLTLADDCEDEEEKPGDSQLETVTKIISEWSPWRRGGYNQGAWCSDVRTNFERNVGTSVSWEILESDERSKEEFYRRFYYKYYCRAQATWEQRPYLE